MSEKLNTAIERLKTAAQMSEKYFHKPVALTYSGGKDSDALLRVAEMSGIEFEVVHSLTTVDAPPTVYHVFDTKKRMEEKGIPFEIRHPMRRGQKVSMWSLIPLEKYPPTRLARYCCKYCKETSVPNRLITTGVRWAESVQRRKNRDVFEVRGKTTKDRGMYSLEHTQEVLREAAEIQEIFGTGDNDVDVYDCRLIESAKKNKDIIVNPIVDWSEAEVWDFCKAQAIPMNPLYFEPYEYGRAGCLMCPEAGKRMRLRHAQDFPVYKSNYMKAFDRMLEARRDSGLKIQQWKNGEEVFDWWISK